MAKRVTITLATAVQRLDEMVVLIEQDVRVGLSVEAALESANEIVSARISDYATYYGANCYNTVKDCMALYLALTLARLFDPGARRFRPNKRDVASIPLLVRLLKQKRCRSALAKRARGWNPQLPSLADSNAAACEREIDSAILTYEKLRRTHKGRRAALTLKEFRDKKLAHSLMGAVLKALPQYQQLFLLMDVARDVTNHAKLAILGNNLDLTDVEKQKMQEAEFFWERALAAAIGTK